MHRLFKKYQNCLHIRLTIATLLLSTFKSPNQCVVQLNVKFSESGLMMVGIQIQIQIQIQSTSTSRVCVAQLNVYFTESDLMMVGASFGRWTNYILYIFTINSDQILTCNLKIGDFRRGSCESTLLFIFQTEEADQSRLFNLRLVFLLQISKLF